MVVKEQSWHPRSLKMYLISITWEGFGDNFIVPSSQLRIYKKVRSKDLTLCFSTRIYSFCTNCGKNHQCEYLANKERCLGYTMSGNKLRDFHSAKSGQGGNYSRPQSKISILGARHLTQQGNSFCTGGRYNKNIIYGIHARHEILLMY